MQSRKLVIFDLDGTLLDTAEDLGNAVNHTLEMHSLPCHDIPAYRMMVGRGMKNLVKEALPETHLQDDFVDMFLKEFLDYYLSHIDCCTVPYPGMTELVRDLDSRGYLLAVASNKIQAGVERLVGKFFPDIRFAAVYGNRPDFPLKPDAALVNCIMKQAGTDAADTLMVGDTKIDIQTAHNAGIKAVAVSWGFRPKDTLVKADVIVDTVQELAGVI